ncbi:Hint domain-containing protein [Neogemmobacter tilapiae]|nr:Hint domain-containing protein [Gemmobacter tilapiae]
MDDEAYQLELLLLTVGGKLCALPLSPMTIATPYTLLRSEEAPATKRLSDALCLSFGRGTRILLASGDQRPIESLEPGDLVLTRDHGPQPLRWRGQTTTRAIGAFAPVIIAAETLGNAGDLIVSQQHRMFVYHREGRFDQAELLVQARHLVNGDTIFLREGGFVDYFALVFDAHEIIYAEGIPVESLLVTEATPSRLPPELQDRFPALRQSPHTGLEITAEAALRLRRRNRQ